MAIAFKCKCGRSMKVRDENAGKKVRCPDCGKGVRIPVLDPTTDDEIRALKHWAKDVDRQHNDANRPTPPPANKVVTPAPDTRSGTPLPKTKLNMKLAAGEGERTPPWIYFAGLAAMAALGVVVWLIWLR